MNIGDRLNALCHPSAEAMSDTARLTAFVRASGDAVKIIKAQDEAIKTIVANPRGCVYCDSGELRLPPRFPHARPDQGHEASCGFAMAEAIIDKAVQS